VIALGESREQLRSIFSITALSRQLFQGGRVEFALGCLIGARLTKRFALFSPFVAEALVGTTEAGLCSAPIGFLYLGDDPPSLLAESLVVLRTCARDDARLFVGASS
jgi:hypothetical protein